MESKEEQQIAEVAKQLVQQVLQSLEEETENGNKTEKRVDNTTMVTSSANALDVGQGQLTHDSNHVKQTDDFGMSAPEPKEQQNVGSIETSEGLSLLKTNAVKVVSSTTSTSTSEEISSVEEVPRLFDTTIHFIQPLSPFSVPIVQNADTHKSNLALNTGQGTLFEDRVYAKIRSSGVGANSPGSPRTCFTLGEPAASPACSTWQPWQPNPSLINRIPVWFEPVQYSSSLEPPPSPPTEMTKPVYCSTEIETMKPLGSSDLNELIPNEPENSIVEMENVDDPLSKTPTTSKVIDCVEDRLGPFTQILPTYTPSRVYLRTIDRNFVHDPVEVARPVPHRKPTCNRSFEVNYADNSNTRDDSLRLRLPDSPSKTIYRTKSIEEVLSPCPICPRYSRRPVKNRTLSPQSQPLRKRFSLSWWQPINTSDPSPFNLPEPNAHVVQRMLQEQSMREQQMANAVAQARREAEAYKASRFEKIRQRALRGSRHRSQMRSKASSMEPTGSYAKMHRESLNGHTVQIAKEPMMLHRTEVRRDHWGDTVHEYRRSKRSTSIDQHSPEMPPSAPEHSVRVNMTRSYDFSESGNTKRFMSSDTGRRTRSKSASRPILLGKPKPILEREIRSSKERSKSRQSTKRTNTTVTKPIAPNTSARRTPNTSTKSVGAVRTRETTDHERHRQHKARKDLSSGNESPETRWKNSLRNNNSPDRPAKRDKTISSDSLTRLRRRCQSIEREIGQMNRSDGHQQKTTGKFDFPQSDSRIVALSSANQSLRTRLEELQRLQAEREWTLRKARTMVDNLISKQQNQAAMMKYSAHCYKQGDTSISSMIPSKSQRSVPVVEQTDVSEPHWTQYPEEGSATEDEDVPISDNSEGLVDPDVTHSSLVRSTSKRSRPWLGRVRQMDSQVVLTHQILDRLRDDYAELARSVSRIEHKTRQAANCVHTLMEHGAYSPTPDMAVGAEKFYSSELHPKYGTLIDPSVESRIQKAQTTLQLLKNDPICYSYGSITDLDHNYSAGSTVRREQLSPRVNFIRSSWAGRL